MSLTKINNNTLSSAGIATGRVLQIIQATDTTSRTTTSNTFVTASDRKSVV
jgi:hypothetical protein